MKSKLDDLERKPAAPRPPGEIVPSEPADLAQIRKWQALAMDPTKDAAERVDALMRLRITPSEPDGRTPEVVGAMLQLLQTSTDARIRADICRHVKRYVPLELCTPLLRSMSSDTDERVREEAAESLGPLNTDPGVRAALEHAAKNDPSEKVRRQAEGSLKGGR